MAPTRLVSSGTSSWEAPWGKARNTRSSPSHAAGSYSLKTSSG